MTARGTAPLEIRGFETQDRDALIELHRLSFIASGELTYEAAARRFEGLLDGQHTLVARRGERIVGFVAFHLFDEHPVQRLAIARMWLWSRLPGQEERIVEWARRNTAAEKRDRVRVQHLLRLGEEDRAGARPAPADAFVTDFAVAEEARRTGVGRALVRELLLRLTRASVPRVWVTTWQAGPSAHLFEGLGFTALVEHAPAYSDGSASRLLVRDVDGVASAAAEADAAGAAHDCVVGVFDPAARDGLWDVLLMLPAVALMSRFGIDALAREPITAVGLTLVCGALAIGAVDRGQRGDRAIGSRYTIAANGISEHRADGGARTLPIEAPIRCAPAALRVRVFSVARPPVVWRVSSPAGSTVVGPLEWIDAMLFAEELAIRFGDVRFAHLAGTVARWLGEVVMNVVPALAVVAIAPVGSRSVMLAGLGASALVAAHRIRRSLVWNDGSPRALWPMGATALIAAAVWFLANG